MSLILYPTNHAESLEIKLTAAKTTNDMPWSCMYVEMSATTDVSFLPTPIHGTTNGTTIVTVVSDAGSGNGLLRQVKEFSVQNADTVPKTAVVSANIAGSRTVIVSVTLAVGDHLCYEDGRGWYVLDSSGQLKMTSSGGSVNIRKNSTGTIYARPRINLIEGSNITLTVADDGTDGEVDVTITGAAGGGLTEATQAEMETASGSTQLVTPRRILNSPSGAKAWVIWTMSGTTVTVQASLGVTSVTRTAQGKFTITWSTAFSSAYYATVVMGCTKDTSGGTTVDTVALDSDTAPTTTAAYLWVYRPGIAYGDPTRVSVAAFGDQ